MGVGGGLSHVVAVKVRNPAAVLALGDHTLLPKALQLLIPSGTIGPVTHEGRHVTVGDEIGVHPVQARVDLRESNNVPVHVLNEHNSHGYPSYRLIELIFSL